VSKENFPLKKHVIIFMDIHEYSIVTRTLGKHLDFLQEVYEILGDIIVAYHGEIIKYMGDALLCVFPAGSEHAVIQCALELRRAYFRLVKSRNISHETELEIGISSGEVEVGIVGHRSLRQKDVLGEVVNHAAMIGHHRGIAITKSVYDKIHTFYKTAKLPGVKVKWQDEPLQAWEITEVL
jgi:class 3 adenylate cyclase